MRVVSTIALILLFAASGFSQGSVTIVLVRHTEKDYTNPKDPNPQLNPVGKERAKLLERAVRKYRVEIAYTTDFIRTRDTVAPIVEKRRIPVTVYDPKKLAELAGQLGKADGKRRILVVGHSNTTTRLVNLLIGENRFPDLLEGEYHRIFVVKLKRGKATVEVFDY